MTILGPWPLKHLPDVVDVLDARRIPVKATERQARGGSVPYYGATGPTGFIDKALFNEPLVLLGEDGVQFFDPHKNKAYLVDGPAWVNNHAHVLRARPSIDRHFLMNYLNVFDYRGFANGTTRLKLTQAAMRRMTVPVPPVEEQRRIVEIIEEHFSHLDAADASLTLASRRAEALEAAVRERAALGERVPLMHMAEVQGGIQKQPKRAPRDNAYPFLRVANVTKAGIDLTEIHKIELFGTELERLRLRNGDLLVVEGNGSASQIGRAALWRGEIEDCVHQNHIIRVRANHAVVPEYLELVWNAPSTRASLTNVASSSSGLHTLSVAKLKALALPLPSQDEQRRRLHEAEATIHQARELRSQIATREQQSAALRRAVLAAAFTGRLTGVSSDADVVEEFSAKDEGSARAQQ